MLDLATETAMPLAAAARIAGQGRGGRPVHLSTILRWILTGCRGPDGQRVRLEAMRLGDRWVTSAEALQRFALALTPDVSADDPAPTPRTPTARRRASDRAARELERAGI